MSLPPSDGLLQALSLSPENAALQELVLDACLRECNAAALRRALQTCGPDFLAQRERRERALALVLEHGTLDDVRAVADADSSERLLEASRERLRLGHREQAQALYALLLSLNPAAENPALAAALSGKLVALHAAAGRATADVAGDDTSAEDVVRLLQPAAAKAGFDDVGGLDTVKQEIRRRIITPFLKPSLFQRFRREAGGGILMYGPPGCGKTLLARATAGECSARFYSVAVTDVLDMYIGESERKLHAIFEQARRTAPAVLFFDELEALGGKRQHAREATSAKLASQFLTELDGFAQANRGVLILAATNAPWAVDPAFRRPGRFDRVLFVPPPDRAARLRILERLLHDRPSRGDLDLEAIARATAGFSGADLRNLVDTAVDEAIERSIETGREQPIEAAHLAAALRAIGATTLEWLTTARNHARYANQGGQYDAVLQFLDSQQRSS